MSSLDSFLSTPRVSFAVAGGDGAVAVGVASGGEQALFVRSGGEHERVAEDLAAGVPPVWAGGDCYFVDEGQTVYRYDTESDTIHGTAIGSASHLVGSLSGDRLVWVEDETDLLAAPRHRLAERESVASGLRLPDRPAPVADDTGELIAYASREDGELHGYVTTVGGDRTVHLGESVLPFDVAGDRDEVLVGSHPFAGAVGVHDIAADETSWLIHETEDDVPFPGIDRPVAFGADPPTIHLRRMVDYVGRPAVADHGGSVRLLDLDGYFDGEANRSPSGRVREGERLLVRESRSNPGEVLLHPVDDGSTRRLFDCTSLSASADRYPAPDRYHYSAVDGDGEMLVYRPETAPPHPTVVELYGGDRTIPPRFDRFARYLVAEGCCYARVRNPAAPWTVAEHRNHASAAKRLAELPFVDADRLVAYGFSMGGYDVRMQAVDHPERWRGGVALSGHSDLLAFDDAVDGSPEIRSQLGDPDENGVAWERVSPRHRVDSVPDFDLTLVDIENDFVPGSGSLVAAFEQRGATLGRDVGWTVIPGQEHNTRSHAEELDRYGVVGDLLFGTVGE